MPKALAFEALSHPIYEPLHIQLGAAGDPVLTTERVPNHVATTAKGGPMFVSLFDRTDTQPSGMVQAYGFVRTDICGHPPSVRCAEVRAALRDNRYQVRAIIRTASSRGFAQLLTALATTPAVAVAVPNLEHLDPSQVRDLIGVVKLLDVATGLWLVSTPPANTVVGLRNR